MNRFEIIKIVGAFLMSVLIITVIGQVGNLLVEAEELEENVYTVAGTEEPAAAEEAVAGEAAAEPGLGPMAPLEAAAEPGLGPMAPPLAPARVGSGEQLAPTCPPFHPFQAARPPTYAPNPAPGRGPPTPRRENCSYSAALASVGGSWGYEELNSFVAKPGTYIPGTRMTFNGLKKLEDRADLIAYLRTFSDSPRPLP